MKRNNKKGFTIVELVIVIAVIAILAAVLIPNLSRLVNKANDSAAMQNAANAMKSDLILAGGDFTNMPDSAAAASSETIEGEDADVRFQGWYVEGVYYFGNYQFDTATGEWSKTETTTTK